MSQVKAEEKPIAIYFLESLLDGELLTGTELHNELSEKDPGRTIEIYNIYGRADLESSLVDIKNRTQANQDRPIIFLEAHGEQNYLEFVGGEKLPWTQLDNLLANINAASQMELITVASACYGIHLQECMQITSVAPVLSAIGPVAEIHAGTLLCFNRQFIGCLLGGKTIQDSLEIANRYIHNSEEHDDERPVRQVTAISYATAAIDRYLALLFCEPPHPTLKIAELHATVNKHAPPGTIIPIDQITKNVRLLAPEILMQRWESFLMLDRFPANAWKFPLPKSIAHLQ